MNFRKAKTILIVAFLAINMFLFGSIFWSAREAASIDGEEIKNATLILSRANISIDESIIPKRKTEGCSHFAPFGFDREKIAENFLGKDYAEDSSGKIFSNDEMSVSFGENFYVFIEGYFDKKPDGQIGEKEALKIAESVIKRLSKGNNIKMEARIERFSGGYIFKTAVKIDAMPVYNIDFKIKVAKDAKVEAQGVLPLSSAIENESYYYSDPINALLSYRKLIYLPDTIKRIEFSYLASLTSEGMVFTPAWKITGEAGSMFFDAATYKNIM